MNRRPIVADGRLWSAQLAVDSGVTFVGEGRGSVEYQGLATLGNLGFAIIRTEGATELWRFELGTTEPSVLTTNPPFGALVTTPEHLYFANRVSVSRTDLDGNGAQQLYDCGGEFAAQTEDHLIVGEADGGIFRVWVLAK